MTGSSTFLTPARPRVLVRTTLEPCAVRTVRVGRVAAAVEGRDAGVDAGIAGGRFRLGSATCGKWAAGSDSAGIVAGSGLASISPRIASTIVTTYGTANEVAQARANQNRMRRVPSPLIPNVPEVPEPCAPAAAGLSRLSTSHIPC